MPLAYLLDENLRGPLPSGIAQYNLFGINVLDVVTVGDPLDLPLGADDRAILLWAEREQRVLVSNDRSTLATHLASHLAAGHHSPGIFLVQRSLAIRPIIDALVTFAYASELDEWRDRIAFIA